MFQLLVEAGTGSFLLNPFIVLISKWELHLGRLALSQVWVNGISWIVSALRLLPIPWAEHLTHTGSFFLFFF